MLRKLLKHEWKSVSKVLIILNLVLILITLMGCCILNTDIFDNTEAIPLAIVLVIFYTFSLSTLGIITLIYLYVRFYKNLFTAEGYLMYTLPVSPAQLFHAKLIVGCFWATLNSLLIMLSIISLAFVAGYHFVDTHGPESINQILSESGLMPSMSSGIHWSTAFQDTFSFTPTQFLLLLFVLFVVSSFVSVLTGYISILLGQLVEKYKLAATVGFYIAIYTADQIICSIVAFLSSFSLMLVDIDSFFNRFYKNVLPFSILAQLLIGLLFYLASVFLMKRKINLD